MSQFEYLSVLISIILALGISECLARWARLLRHRDVVAFYWVHSAFTLITVLVLVELWWGFWQFVIVEQWSFFGLVAVVAEYAALVVAILVITPSGDEVSNGIDLRAFYYAHARLFFSIAAVAFLALIAVDVLIGGQPLWHPENAIRPAAALLCAALAYWRHVERLHAGAVLVGTALFVAFVAAAGSR